MLLKHGAKWDQPDQQQMTPLLLAASAHSPGSLALFLEHGADLNATHPTLGNLLSLAQRTIGEDSIHLTLFPGLTIPRRNYQRMLDTVRLILDHQPLLLERPHPGFGQTPLSPLATAIVLGQTAIVNELLARGAKVNTADASGVTPLLLALAPNISIPPQGAMIDRLLAAGADPNLGIDLPLRPGGLPSPLKTAIAQQSFGRAPLTSPTERRALVERLLRHGARFASAKGSAAEKMLLAATTGDLVTVRKELANGTSPNVADDRGWTPLMSAFGLSHHAVAGALLDAGAEVKARDASGLTPLWLAIAGHAPRATIERLLDLVADPDTRPNAFGSPLAMAIMVRNDPALAELLLQRGADVKTNGVSGEGEASLFGWVLLPDRAWSVPLLLRYGADPNPSDDGETALHLAIREKLPDAVAQLLAAGADPLKTDGNRQTALDAARQSGDPKIVKLVEEAAAGGARP